MKRYLALLSFALLFPAAAVASLEFRVISWRGDIEGLRFSDGQSEVVLSVRERVLSPVYRHAGAGKLELYRLEGSAAQPASRVVVASLPPPQASSRALLVLSPSRSGRIEGMWLDDATEANPAGTLRLHNFSTHKLAVQVGQETHLLSSSGNARVSFSAALRTLPVQVAAEVAGQWQRVVSTSQPVRPRYRLIVLLRDGRPTPDDPAGLVEWLAFYDTPSVSSASVTDAKGSDGMM